MIPAIETTTDPVTALVALLGTVMESRDQLEAAKVFGHELPDDQDEAMPQACLVVTGAGGPTSGGYLPLSRQRVDLRAYGATHAQAMDVARNAHAVLKYLRRTTVDGVVLHSVDVTSGYTTLRDADGRWPLVLRSYEALYDDREVA